jgi:Ala-tRNA(Pro) deacylase
VTASTCAGDGGAGTIRLATPQHEEQEMTAEARIAIDARLQTWLDEHHVPFEIHPHAHTYTAVATARAEGVEPQTFAKVIGVRTDEGRLALVVLDAIDELDLAKLSLAMGSTARLMTEPELAEACPDWEIGTVPPVPSLAGLQVFADDDVRSDERISFRAGSHEVAVRVDRAGWETAAEITYGDLARNGVPTA